MTTATLDRPIAAERPAAAPSRPRETAARDRADRALFVRYRRNRDARTQQELVERFLPLARWLAHRYHGGAEPLDDLVQVASLGLVKAIDRFDPERGLSFSTFAVPTITGEIKRHFRDCTWAVRPPRHLQDLSLLVDRAITRLSGDLHRAPTVPELAAAVQSDEEQVLEALQARGAAHAVSLHSPAFGDEDAATLGDLVGVPEDGFDHAEARATLARLLRSVTRREREVLRLRFEEDMTQAEIGAIIGVSQMQASRIIRQAIQRLQSLPGSSELALR
jgi:RNA polymerase sigma-B factor